MASDTPRSSSSNSNLADSSRKASIQGNDLSRYCLAHFADPASVTDIDTRSSILSSTDTLATPISISSPKMAVAQHMQPSVLARAKAFDARAQATRGVATFSPSASPPPLSPFVKSIGAQILIPQSTSRSASAQNGSQGTRSASNTQPNTPIGESAAPQAPHSATAFSAFSESQSGAHSPSNFDMIAPGSISSESLPATLASRKPSVVQVEGGSSEDDRTPRQSISNAPTPPDAAQPKLSRMDSSRQTNYSLKARTYSPDAENDRRGSGRAEPPRLPKLYFEGSLTDYGQHPAMPSAKSIKSPYSSPHTELARAGWSSANDSTAQPHKHGPSLTVPVNMNYSGQTVDSPPPDDLDASNRSFFWHSPNDTDDTDDDADLEDNPGGFPSLPRRSDTNMTSANVFGPGGPSDWEHFYGGDYETVDDTDIYLTTKEKERIKREEQERLQAAVVARRNSEPDETHAAEATNGVEGIKVEEDPTATRLRAEPSLPTIEETAQESIEPETEAMAEEDQKPGSGNFRETELEYSQDGHSLDGFATSPPPATPATFAEKPPELREPAVSHQVSKETIKPVDIAEDPNTAETSTTSSDEADTKPEIEQQRPDSEVEPTAVRALSHSRTPPPPEIKMPEPTSLSPGGSEAGPSSPPIDDPNAGHITVSMVLPADTHLGLSGLTSGPSFGSPPATRSPPPATPGFRKSIFPQADEQPNPYAGLSPMAKASLNRFVRMLREEEKAESDQDKFFVFLGFAQHEMKLRATLYDMDDEEVSLPPSKRASARSSINKKLGSRHQSSLRSKPLPAAPAMPPPYDPTLGHHQSKGVSVASRLTAAASSASAAPPPHPPPNRAPPPAPGSTAKSSDDSYVMVETPEGKSLNGEEKVQATDDGKKTLAGSRRASVETLNKTIDLVAPRTSITSTPSNSAEAGALDRASGDAQSTASSPLPGAQILNHSLSVRSNESKPYDGDKATNRQSIYRPFSGMLRSASSHRRASMESVRTLKSMDKPERKATDPASLAEVMEQQTAPQTEEKTSRDSAGSPHSPASRTSSLEPLVAVVPHTNILREEPHALVRLRFDMDNIVDDFSFIHKTVLAWDSGAKVKRERHEHERQLRLAANERRVEDLFNDNEIGYADISQLEAEFKQQESVKKAEEEREEVESFVASVFDVVWARINYEMDQLTPLYQEATALVADASAGKQMFEETDERVPIAPIMEVLLILYQKLMIRHQKAFEAVLERDRRLKKTEVSPWFAIGQIDKVKRIEKRFEDAEKKAILEFCRQRDERANLLMDVLDQHTLRGVGANQDYMEGVMQAVRRISIQLAKAQPDSSTSVDEVLKAKFITIALSRSSEQIVRTFHIADMLLNAADYEVSVANAKLSNADTAAFRRLREAKAKEDAKLAADLEHRLGLIKGDTARTQEEIGKLMALMGQDDPDLVFDLARERDKRLVAALTDKSSRKSQDQTLQLPVA